VPQLQESKMATCSVRYESHLSDKARSSESSRFSITKIRYAYIWVSYNIPPNSKPKYSQENFILEQNQNIHYVAELEHFKPLS